jgi:Ca2+-binding RTX toxin-like protein
MFVPAFTSAASWYLGFVAQQSGIPVAAAINGGGLWNQWQNGQWIPQPNINSINAGATFGRSLPPGQSLDTDSVTLNTAGVTIDNDSATIRGRDNQIVLSGSNDTLNLTGPNDTLDLTGSLDTITTSGTGNTLKTGDTLDMSGGSLKLAGNATVTLGLGGNVVVEGRGNNVIKSSIVNLTIDLGTGTNIVGHVGRGTVVNAQSQGQDSFVMSDDELITGSTPTDQIFTPGGILLRGAVGQIGSSDPWIVGPDGTKYGFNQQGDLVIQDLLGDNTYVSGYQGGPSVSYADQTDGIFVGLSKGEAEKLLDLARPFITYIDTIFKVGQEILYTKSGLKFFHVDPLVFDLTGQGVNLTAMSTASPMLDMLGTGFAVHTGWVEPNDGVLVLQQPGQDGTPNVTEMFGGPGAQGFAALAQYDANSDGVIDANDPIYSQLRIWVDSNGNGVVDAGELETLQQAGIASINLTAAAQTNDTDAGNTIVSTGTFTFTNGTTGNVDQVNFNVDSYHTQYLGDTTVSTAAAAMPNLKGYGTLTDLQVAMTLDPSLIDTVNANLPNLDVPDLASLRAAATPIFTAWAEAVELPDANGNPQVIDPAAGNSDVALLISSDADSNATVYDYAYQATDGSGNKYWALASGNHVYDQNGNLIAEPTFTQVLAQSTTNGQTWIDFTAAEIGFISRFYGQPFQLDQLTKDGSTPLDALTDLMQGAFGILNLEAVRLAMQGPLAQYFPDIAYDATTDSFTATTQQQLSPMYQAIFAAAPSDQAGATAWLTDWLPVINIVLGDFAQSNGTAVTYGYQFASMVHAFEQANLPLSIAQVAEALGVPSGEVISGGSTLSGPNTASIYYMAGGDQTVTAGKALNNFVMGGTFGHDTIIEDEPALGPQDESILRLTSVASTDVTATRNGLDLVLSVNGTDEQITVKNEFSGTELSFNGANFADNWGVAQIQFSDGVLWDMPDIAKAVSRPQPDEATILGTPGMDVLDGGVGGNNFLSGGDGNDIYKFGVGYGHDTILVNQTDPFNNSTDYVQFGAGISFSDLTFSRQGDSNDLLITDTKTGDELTILDQFGVSYSLFGMLTLDRVDAFAFADGSTYAWSDIIDMMDAQAGKQAAIYGFDGYNDVLDPGPGVHYLSGGNGDKTYLFDFGYGFDTVQDNVTNILADSSNNVIQFGADVTEQDVTFSLAGNSRNLVITLSDGSTMVIDGEFSLNAGLYSFNIIQNFQFADGTTYTWNQVLQQIMAQQEAATNGVVFGSDYADVFDTGANGGNHYLSGGDAGNGVDTYVFGHGYGNETVDVNWSNLLRRGGEVISFTADVTPDQVHWSAVGQDLVIKLDGSNDSLTVLGQFAPWFYEDGVTSFAFADGTTLSLADVANMVFNGAGGGATIFTANELNLRLGPAVFQCGPGDVFIGSGAVPFTTAGNTFDFNQGDGFNVIVDPAANGIADNIAFGTGITPGMVQTYLLGTNMIFTIQGSADEIAWMDNGGYTPNGNVFDAVGSVTFADGTTWSTSDLLAQADVAPTLSVTQNGSNYEVDYNINQGYASVTLPYEQQGTTTTLRISGLDPNDVDIQRVGFPEADGNADAAAILISAAGSTAGGLLVGGPQYSTDLEFDQIVFDDGTVWTKAQVEQMLVNRASASTSNTEIDGFSGNDTLYAGTGDDVLAGGAGNDTYVYKSGDGSAQIVVNKPADSGTVDTLDFADIASTAVTLSRWPGNGINNLVISVAGQAGQVTIENQFVYGSNPANAAINQITFSDGVTWTEQDIESKLIAQEEAQTGPNINVYGFADSNTLSAVAGSSTLTAGTGADTYVWNAGDGATWISDQGSVDSGFIDEIDTLLIHGIDPSTVTVSRDPTPGVGNLILTSPGQSPIILEGQTANQSNSVIEQVVFDDGTTWNDTQLLIEADGGIATTPNGTTARTFAGAAANSTMSGTSSDDVYFWGAGDGNDTIAEGDYDPWQKVDTVKLAGLNPGDVALNIIQGGDRDLVITDKATGETLTVDGQFATASSNDSNTWPGAGRGIELLQFADGTTWDAQQILDNSAYIAAPGATTLANEGLGDGSIPMQASPGVQDLYGRSGVNNTFMWSPGDGSDTMYFGGADTLRLTGVAVSDVELIRAGNSLLVTDAATGETITMPFDFPDQTSGPGVAQITFDDGTVWNRAYINANAAIYAGTGDNTIYGPSDPVIFNVLAAGNDTINGGGNGDTILDGPNSGNDTINESGPPDAINALRLTGIDPSQVKLSFWGNDLYVQRADSGKTVLVLNQFAGSQPNAGVEQIVFDDGTAWNKTVIAANAGPLTFTWVGTASDTTLTANSYGNNVFDLGPGGDTVNFGYSGTNTIVFDKGDGHAQVNLDGGTGTVQMASDIAASDVYLQADNNGDLFIKLRDSTDSITVYGDLEQHWWGISSQLSAIDFADGTTLSLAPPSLTWIGTSSNTTLAGSDFGNNVFDLGLGGDTVYFDYNNANTLVFDKGDGQVQVNVDGGTGIVQMAADIVASDVYLQADNNGDLFIKLRDSSDSIALYGDLQQHWWGVSSQVTEIDFADGTTLSLAPPSLTWIGTATDTTLDGSSAGNNVFDLGPGGDTVNFSYNTGNTLVFDKGDGQVQVNVDGGTGIVQMAADIAASDVILQDDNNGDLTIALRDDSSDSITLYGDLQQHWWGVSSQVTEIDFADGATLALGPFTFTWIGTASNTTLTGSNDGGNEFDLGPGNDTVNFAGNGSNTIVFDKGDGQVQVNLNGGTGIVRMAADIADDDVYLQADNSGDLTIKLRDSSDSITVANDLAQNWYGISSQLTQIMFADGSTFNIGSPGYNTNPPPTFTWIGTATDTALTGSSYGNNTYDLGSGGDAVTFAGNGGNTVVFDKGDGQAQVNLNGGTGTVQMAADIADDDVYLQADNNGDLTIKLRDSSDSITVANDLTQNWYGISSQLTEITFADGTILNIGSPGYNTNPPPTFTYFASGDGQTLTGSSFGNNILESSYINDVLVGGGGSTTLISDAGGNTLEAGTGSTTAIYAIDNVTVNLAAGTASVNGSATNDVLVGIATAVVSASDDTIVAGTTADTLVASGSNDTLFGNAAGSTLDGTAGTGTVAAYAINDVTVDLSADTATVNGSGVSDTLLGISAAAAVGSGDTLLGGSGTTTLISNADGNTLEAGSGSTTALYATSNVTVNLATGAASVNGSGTSDVLVGITAATVAANHDTIVGGSGVQTLSATGSLDSLVAGSGADLLVASGTNDTLFGNAAGATLNGTAGTGAVAAYAINNVTVNLAAGTAAVNGASVGDTLLGINAAKVLGTGDAIIGGAGAETLSSSGSNNTLIAGTGLDTLSSSGTGDVLESNASGNALKSTGTLTVASYALSNAAVNLATGSAKINGASIGDTLTGIKRASVTGNDDTLTAGAGAEVLAVNGSGNTLIGGTGADTFVSNAGGNTLEAGTGAATASYTANNLTVNLATGAATISGSGVSDTLVGITRVTVTGNNDTLTTDGTTDTLSAIGNNDTLIGGAAVSSLSAIGSGDVLRGGSAATTLISNAGGNTLEAGTGRSVASYSASGMTVNLATGTAGVNGSGRSDSLIGITDVVVSGNNDTLIADGGTDTLSLTGSNGTLIGGSGTATLTATGSNNILQGGSGTTTLISNAGGNTLIAGAGATVAQYATANVAVNLASGTAGISGTGVNDTLVGITDVVITGIGDAVTGGAGTDTLTAKGKNDTLIGGSGGGTLTTTSSSDLLIGGSGTTTLASNANGNTLQAGSGQTVASYALSNLTVDLGAGVASHGSTSDTLIGITDVAVTGGADILIAGAADQTLTVSGSNDTLYAASAGDDDLQVTNGSNDTFVATVGGNTLVGDANHTTVVYTGDGLTIDLATDTATINATGVTDSLVGITNVAVTGNSDTLIADGSADTLSVTGSNDKLIGGSGTATLAAAGSGDILIGGSGTTTLVGTAAGDTLEAGTGKTTATYAASSLAVNLATGTAAVNGAGTSDALVGITNVVTGGSNDTLTAGSGTDTLTANGSGATLTAGSGTDRLTDTSSGGFYQFSRGDGITTIVNGAAGATSPSNELDFAAGVSDENLWFIKSGNNLQIDIMGTNSHVTVSGWFANAGKDLQEITAGGLAIDSQVSSLVQAMATYSANNHGFSPTASGNTQAPNDPNLQAAIAAAWHH